MSEMTPVEETPAKDDGDENPDLMVGGGDVTPDHDLDLGEFDEVQEVIDL